MVESYAAVRDRGGPADELGSPARVARNGGNIAPRAGGSVFLALVDKTPEELARPRRGFGEALEGALPELRPVAAK